MKHESSSEISTSSLHNNEVLTEFEYEEVASMVTAGKQDESEADLEKWILSKFENIVNTKLEKITNVTNWETVQ